MRLLFISLLTMGCRTDKSEENTNEGATDLDTEAEPDVEGDDDEDDEEEAVDPNEGTVSNNTPISSLTAGVSEFTLDQVVAGQTVQRRFLIHTPDNFDDSQSTPLLFAFHGNGGEPESYVYEVADAIEDGHFIGVYPAGLEYSWNLGPEASEADDVAFTEAILGMLTTTTGVDATKPVALGFSNGAGMVHELAMESQSFVAISPATSHMLTTKTPNSDSAYVSVLQFSGTEDTLVPYQGGTGVLEHDFLPAEDSTGQWAVHNGCDASPTTSADIDGPEIEDPNGQFVQTSYTLIEWENCSTGAKVVHVRLNNIGHDLPGDMIVGGSMPYIYDFLLESRQ